MKFALLRHELNLMLKNKKNILFIFFLLVVICSYVFIILPNTETIESFDSERTEAELAELENMQIAREGRRHTGVVSGYSFFADNNYKYILKSGMFHAYQDGDFKRYTHIRTHYLTSINERVITNNSIHADSPFPVKDRTHYIDKQIRTYQSFLDANIPITYEMIEEKTALQTFKNLLLTIAPYLMIFCAIYFSNDILVQDRKQVTTLQGLPVSWYQLINGKSLVAFFYTLLALLGLMGVTALLLTLKNGFGSFHIEVPTFLGYENPLVFAYGTMPIMKFLIQSLILAPIFIFIFIRLNMILSLLFRNEWAVLVLGSLFLYTEQFYFARDKRELFGIDISNFPQTYFDFGNIVTGEKNFLINLESLSYTKGLIVLLITFVVIELILFIMSLIINRQRFYRV